MFKCEECGFVFNEPREYNTTHEDYNGVSDLFPGSSTPLVIFKCPHCQSDEIYEIEASRFCYEELEGRIREELKELKAFESDSDFVEIAEYVENCFGNIEFDFDESDAFYYSEQLNDEIKILIPITEILIEKAEESKLDLLSLIYADDDEEAFSMLSDAAYEIVA